AASATMRKRFLYVSNNFSHDISGFSINPATGASKPIPGSPFPTGGSGGLSGISLAVTPNGKFLYAGNGGSNNISEFSVAGDGVLTRLPRSPFFVGGHPDGIKVSPNGKWLGVALGFPAFVAMLSIGSDGELASVPGSPFSQDGTGDEAAPVDMSCKSNLLFGALGAGPHTGARLSTTYSHGALKHTPRPPPHIH